MHRLAPAILAVTLAASLSAPADVSGGGGLGAPPDPSPHHSPGPIEADVTAARSVADNFNRTTQSPYWGSTSTGFVSWLTFNTGTQCQGYTANVNGSNGVMTGSAGAGCITGYGVDQQLPPTADSSLPWEGPSWAFTGSFKVGALDGSRLAFRVTQDNVVYGQGFALMKMASSGGDVELDGSGFASAPFAWAANTWYKVKWVVVWGDQARLKVWNASDPEPAAWLLTTTMNARQSGPWMVTWDSHVGTNSVFVDDFAFGLAPILPKLPPPPGTEDNPPYVNGDDAGDPVNTQTGTLSDSHLDVAIPGRGPTIQFARSYNSNDTRVTTLGPGWTHSYNIRLTDPNDGTNDIILVGPQGRSDRYVESGGAFTAPLGVHRSLVRNADDTYTATDKAQTQWRFDPTGRLTQIRDRFGNATTLTYDGSSHLTSISDPAGRGSLTLGYTGNLLTTVTDWASPARTVTYQYDGSGRLWKVTDREGKTTTLTYDGTSQRLTTVADAKGHVALTTTYDAQGRVATQKDARGLVTGDVTTFDYVVNPDNTRQTTINLPVTSFEPSFHPTLVDTYDVNGWLTSRTTQPSQTETLNESFGYDAAGNRTSMVDPRSNETDFCYDVDYDGTAIPGGAANLTRVIAPAPEPGADRPVTLSRYDAKNNQTQVVAPQGVPSGPTVTCSTNLAGVSPTYVTDFAYDGAGATLLASTSRFTDPDTGTKTAVTKFEYADAANPGLVTRIIPPRGNTGPSPDYTYATTFSYYGSGTRSGLLKDVTDALGNKTSYDYDPAGHLVSVVDPLGNATGGVPADHTTSYSFDKEDRLRFATRPAPASGQSPLTVETRYDEVGKPIVRIDARGQVTTFSYDERNSLAQVKESPNAWTDPASPPGGVITTEYSYDSAGNTVRVLRAKGDGTYESATDYAFDGRGLARTETQYPTWPATTGSLVGSSTYDPSANLQTTVDPLGRTTTYGHDALNRLTSVEYSDTATPDVAYVYDADGNRSSMTDGTGMTTYAHDEAGRLTEITSPGPETVGYRYDLDGNRTKLIYPDGAAVTYTFDKASELASLQDWASRSVAYTYWPDGLVRTATNPDASVATYSYDNARRLTDVSHARSGVQIARFFYTLDAPGNVTSVANGGTDIQFERPDGLVSSNGTWAGTFASINEATPNDATFLASPTSPTTSNYYEVSLSDVSPPFVTTGTVFRYRYAKSGNNSGKTINLTVELRQGSTVIAADTHTNIPGVAGSGWQQATITLTAPQAAMVTNVADLRLRFRPSSTGGGQGREAQISWAEVQLPAAQDPATLFSYGYDRLSRLTSVSGADGPRSYTYDPLGNRLTNVAGATTSYTYDHADRLLTAGAASVTVDANGNLTARGVDTFGFDQANRLTSATVAGASEAYAYDGDGTRFSRTVGANPAIRYVSDSSASLPVTLADGTRKYVYGLDLAYAVSGSSIEVYHTDRLGSVQALTDGTGTVTATYRTDEWGVPTTSTGGSTQPYGYTGEPADATGLSYLRARYYDPTLGRFTSRDTWTGSMATSGTQNRYAYAGGNPVSRTDPSGRCFVDTFADVAFIGWDVLSLVFGPEKDRGTNWLALGADAGGAALPCATGLGIAARGGIKWVTHASRVAPDLAGLTPKILRQMEQRGWSSRQIQEAFEQGQQVLAENFRTGGEATRYIHPTSGKSVVIDDATGEVIHVGGPGFRY